MMEPAKGKDRRNAPKWSLIVAVNDEHVFRQTLLRSPAIGARCEVIIKRGYKSAGEAYNAGIKDASNEILVLAHQDVYLPTTWLDHLSYALKHLDSLDTNWAVLGVYGITRFKKARGHIYSTGLGRELGAPFRGVLRANSLDEMLLVLRRSSGLVFDDRLPGFHLYGTDICLEAHHRNRHSYIISAFCIHNSNGVRYFPLSYWRAYFYLRRKWWHRLPITTCCTTISRDLSPAAKVMLRDLRAVVLRQDSVGRRSENPDLLYQTLLAE